MQKLVALKAIPKEIQLTIEYKLSDGEWKSLYEMDENKSGIITIESSALASLIQDSGLSLPKCDQDGNEISYRYVRVESSTREIVILLPLNGMMKLKIRNMEA